MPSDSGIEERLSKLENERMRTLSRLRRYDNPQDEDLEEIVDEALVFRARRLAEAQQEIDELYDELHPLRQAILAVTQPSVCGLPEGRSSLSFEFSVADGREGWVMCSRSRMRELIDKEKLAKQALDALQQLYDYQNGPPLYKYEDGWSLGMKMAREALDRGEELISDRKG